MSTVVARFEWPRRSTAKEHDDDDDDDGCFYIQLWPMLEISCPKVLANAERSNLTALPYDHEALCNHRMLLFQQKSNALLTTS